MGALVRVSSTRVGATGTSRPAVAVAAGCQAPTTSMARWVDGLGEDVDGTAVADRHDHEVREGLPGRSTLRFDASGAGGRLARA